MSDDPNQTPDFRREVSISDRAGAEFFGVKLFNPSQMLVGFGPQIAIGVLAVMYAVVGSFTALPMWGLYVVLPLGLIIGIVFIARFKPTRRPDHGLSSAFASGTDPRFRLRLVAPRMVDQFGVMPWLRSSVANDTNPDEEELGYRAGGFEPVVVRAWFCMKRDRWYSVTLVVAVLLVMAIAGLGAWLLGGSISLWLAGGVSIALFGIMILIAIIAMLAAEAVWPAYLRLAPGRLDLFRYPLFGRGRPSVKTYDLRRVGLCVHLGVWAVAIEPERPFEGEGPPEMTRSKTWPYNKVRLPQHQPETLSLGLIPRRREFVCKLFQAARTDEPTPPLPEHELTG